MSSVLTSFLVGIGWDTSGFDQGTKHIESSMGSVKSSVLQTAASIGALTALTGAGLKFAETTSQIDNFTRSIGVGRSDLLAFGGALQGMGGDADSAMGILTSLEQKRASILTGDTGWIPTAARAGINTDDILQASDSLDAVLRLSDQFQQLSAQQRLNAAEALGFDPATVAFLSQGRDVVEATLNQYRDARPLVDGLTEASRDLTQEWSRLEALAGGIGDKVQSKLIPAITSATSKVNEFLNANKQAINEGIDKYATPENIESAGVAAAGAGVATGGAVAGSLLQRVGLTGTGALVAGGARLAGGAGIAYGVSDIVSRAIDEQLSQFSWYSEQSEAFSQGILNATGYFPTKEYGFLSEDDPRLGRKRDSWWDLSRGNVNEGTAREPIHQFTAPDSAWTPGYGSGPTPPHPAIPETVKPAATETDRRPPTPVELIDNRDFKPVIELASWDGFNGSPEPAKNPQPEMMFDWGNIVKEWGFDSLRDDVYSGATIKPTAPEVIPPVDDRRNRDVAPTRQPTTINVNATLEMDGKVLAEKVLSVVSDSNQAALDDLQSTTER